MSILSPVYFGGSRSLVPPSPLVGQVVGAVLASGAPVHVGCSAGADALVVECVLSWSAQQQGSRIALSPVRSSSFQQMRVFSAFAPSGAGACSVSNVQGVCQFAQAGGSVSWLAGGSLAVPMAARLIRRSLAALAGCSAAVFFAPSSGSLAVASHAVKSGIPVFAFGPMPAAIPGAAGCWVSSSFFGFSCWQWSAAQMSLF